jgi:chromate transporter
MKITGNIVPGQGAPAPFPEKMAGHIHLKQLFLGFLKIGLLGFGGLAPVAHHVIVEDRAWVTEQEYASLLGLGQVLPGGNIINLAVIMGDRFQGIRGSLTALAALMAMPLAILMALALLYERFAGLAMVRTAIGGSAAVAAGLVIGTAAKILWKLRLSWIALLFAAMAFAAVGLLQLSLVPVIVVLAPLSVGIAYMMRRRS